LPTTDWSLMRHGFARIASIGVATRRWRLIMNGMPETLPRDVVSLLDRLDSVLQMEVLIALYDAQEPLAAEVLTRRFGGSVGQVRECLDGLVGLGLACAHTDPKGSAYSYRTNEMDHTMDRLAELYITRKVRVVAALLRSA
jgi:hypothetical protein